jgi:serine/threonine protein kinase
MIERSPLAEADRAERAGDPIAAALALRRHLAENADDHPARLRLARLLIAAGERAGAREALARLETTERAGMRGLWRDVERALAMLDEAEGSLAGAAARWERLLADDIDDAQARAHLGRLRPAGPSAPQPDANATLVSPEGVETLHYRLVREIGRGATATVYLARDEALDLSVALKILHPQLAAGPLGRFLAGARLLGRLRHPGLVAVYDVDETARALAMEWIEGGTLRARLAAHPEGLPAEEVAETGRALLDALGFLHGRGIVHGDLKPSNLLVRAPGQVVLADFGGAARVDRPAATTRLGEAGGTPLYLAPEQFHGAAASKETDLYAAGAILWEAATGRPLRSQSDLLRARPASGASDGRSPDAEARLRARVPAAADAILALLDPSPSARRPWGPKRSSDRY